MMLELRVLSGSRAGAREKFDQPIVSVGRHAMSDLHFDPQGDLDVSTRHAEFREASGIWTIADQSSTNGTFVNGERITGERRLNDGDVVSFGANGPRVEVRGVGRATPATAFQPELKAGAPVSAPKPRMDTSARVAVAVREQTRSMRRGFMLGGGALIAAGAVGFFFWQRVVTRRELALTSVVAHSDSTLKALEKQLASARPGDSVTTAAQRQELQARKRDIANMNAQIAGGTATRGSVEALSKRMDRTSAMQRSIAQMDLSKVYDLNDAAVAMVASDFDGKYIAGTAFGITRSGLLVTNRHVVRSQAGLVARRILVIFANTTNAWLPVRIVRLGESDDDDLALLQIDVPGNYPVVAGVSREGAAAKVGAPVAAIGYPGATDLPMEGTGLKITARTTITPGTVSKRLGNVIQLDSYAAHGASGSPLFDAAGNVVGVIYGGDLESHGKIVYAVPAQRLAAFLGADGGSILR